MPITYRQHQDTRDGKIYNCVLMPDGKWWSAENLAWEGAGRHYNDDPANGPIYGKLYYWDECASAVPPGAHFPDGWDLGYAYGGDWADLKYAISALNPNIEGTVLKKSSSLWTVNTGTDLFGFAAIPGGRWNGYSFAEIGAAAHFWGATVFSAVSAYGFNLNGASSAFSGATSPKDMAMSVRFIVDVFNEPIPPTKIKGTFSGSGVKVFCSNYNTPTFELPLSAQTTTELTIKKDFIATWGAALGNVRILVVDGEYISDWKDWNFNA